ncbi:hypothetical protein [Nonomuraea sp. NPDC002799]
MGETKSRDLARAGEFPIEVLTHGNRSVCRKVDLIAYLRLDLASADANDATSLTA